MSRHKHRTEDRRSLILVYWHHFVLLIHMNSTKLNARGDPDPWGLPGGKVHRKESPLAAAIRELKQETGRKLHPDRLTFRASFYVEEERRRYYVFSTHWGPQEKPYQIRLHPEFKAFRWVFEENMPWDVMLPLHEKWLPRVLRDIKRSRKLAA